MPIHQEDIDRYGMPMYFQRRGEVVIRVGLSGVGFHGTTIPLDGRQYICGGEIVLANGRHVDAHFELDTARARPLLEKTIRCTPDNRKSWYTLDEPELLTVLGVSAAEAFPVSWRTGMPLDHPDPGPYPIGWKPRG